MAYTKKTWVDRVLAGAATYLISGTGAGQSITLDQTVTTPGTELLAAFMNAIETGIENAPQKYTGKTTAPTVNDDSDDGYGVGDRWLDETSDKEYVVLDVTVGAAVWIETTGGGGSTDMPSGFLINGKISVSVASNDLTVAVKNLAGNDPSAGDPVLVRIGEVEHTLTAALSVTALDATNWCNAGSSELATQLINYFVYLGYNSTDGVTIGFSRIPYAIQYDDFSTTNTDEDYCKVSDISNAGSTDAYENVGRFSATLSAGAGYTWTISGTGNVISHPILETEILTWAPSYSASVSMTFTSVSTSHAEYQVISRNAYYQLQAAGTIGGTVNKTVYATLPFDCRNRTNQPAQTAWVVADSVAEVSFAYLDNVTASTLAFRRTSSSNWVLGASKYANGAGLYTIA